MTTWQYIGLAILIVFAAATPEVLLYDLGRFLWGKWINPTVTTISQTVWLEMRLWRKGQGLFPWWSLWLVAGIQAAGTLASIGLFIHFYARTKG